MSPTLLTAGALHNLAPEPGETEAEFRSRVIDAERRYYIEPVKGEIVSPILTRSEEGAPDAPKAKEEERGRPARAVSPAPLPAGERTIEIPATWHQDQERALAAKVEEVRAAIAAAYEDRDEMARRLVAAGAKLVEAEALLGLAEIETQAARLVAEGHAEHLRLIGVEVGARDEETTLDAVKRVIAEWRQGLTEALAGRAPL